MTTRTALLNLVLLLATVLGIVIVGTAGSGLKAPPPAAGQPTYDALGTETAAHSLAHVLLACRDEVAPRLRSQPPQRVEDAINIFPVRAQPPHVPLIKVVEVRKSFDEFLSALRLPHEPAISFTLSRYHESLNERYFDLYLRLLLHHSSGRGP